MCVYLILGATSASMRRPPKLSSTRSASMRSPAAAHVLLRGQAAFTYESEPNNHAKINQNQLKSPNFPHVSLIFPSFSLDFSMTSTKAQHGVQAVDVHLHVEALGLRQQPPGFRDGSAAGLEDQVEAQSAHAQPGGAHGAERFLGGRQPLRSREGVQQAAVAHGRRRHLGNKGRR